MKSKVWLSVRWPDGTETVEKVYPSTAAIVLAWAKQTTVPVYVTVLYPTNATKITVDCAGKIHVERGVT